MNNKYSTLEELKAVKLKPVDKELAAQIKKNWDQVAKPLDGLGEFEGLTARIGAILGSEDIDISKKAVIAMCADNGIVEEGVSQCGQEVTASVTRFMGLNQTSVGKMAACVGAEVIPVDIGINSDEEFEGVRSLKVRKGTKNFLKEPAMTQQEALAAISTGIDIVRECKSRGIGLLGTGEMGIGNTTTSTAMTAAMLGLDPRFITGRGAGLNNAGLKRKTEVIIKALDKYAFSQEETFRILCSVGGLDIAGLAGVFIGGAIYGIPVVIDGVISAVAAMCAQRLIPGVKEYMIPSHQSREPAAAAIMKELGVTPVIFAGLALGEGTGAVMMFSLLDIALSLYQKPSTFNNIEVKQYERFDTEEEEVQPC